jgi:hypothetical protein
VSVFVTAAAQKFTVHGVSTRRISSVAIASPVTAVTIILLLAT